jgi:hypothetical protein
MVRPILSALVASLILASLPSGAFAFNNQPVAKIEDNSFLIEEAYNQDEGIVHTVQNFFIWDDRSWNYLFTQEWPVPNVTNQLSFSVPVNHDDESSVTGLGDMALNYRYQALLHRPIAEAQGFELSIAPRLSLVLPTGSVEKGFGRNSVGIQIGIPVSIDLGDHWTTNINVGGTFTPKSEYPVGPRANAYDFYCGENLIFLPHRNINFLVEVVYYNFDWYRSDNSRYRQQNLYINPAVRGAINFKNGFQIVPGLSVPIGVGPSLDDYSLFFYLSIEGPFWKPRENN